ncbi:MAG: hypothetical protein H7A24_11580 [Leptospiraceae bacterium]|nr:hypothetical protein [Leptospiraceae bacterium]MCP5512513.1 hypothetical protein [Leptospiraceae bacterium]
MKSGIINQSFRSQSAVEPIVNLFIGTRSVLFEEMDSILRSFSDLYYDVLSRGRNNNSDLAISIREYTESIFEILEEFQDSQLLESNSEYFKKNSKP